MGQSGCVFCRKMAGNYWPFLLVFILGLPIDSECLRLTGTLEPSQTFFYFLVKFGFQKTEILDKDATQGYIYGNVTFKLSDSNKTDPEHNGHVTFAVLDRANFLEYYGNASLQKKSLACQKMFSKINQVAYDSKCFDEGQQDFLRAVPCPPGQLCPEEDNPDNVIPGAQFTYRIQDLYQARFWYVSMVACQRNETTCHWDVVENFQGEIHYDINLVNGNPLQAHKNVFKYQFSSDQQDLYPVYLILLLVYVILTPLQIYASFRQEHPIAKLLACGLLMQFLALFFINLNYSLLAFAGLDTHSLAVLGEILEILSESLFMLLLLLLAMGWALTRQPLSYKNALISLWLAYTSLLVLLYIWMKTEVDLVDDIEEYQTVPGIITLVMRIVVMICFVLALRETMLHEYDSEKLNFFLHFGAASMVWFNYLPILSIIAVHISALWREKFLIGVSYSVDTFAYAILMHLLWPGRSQQYFLLAVKKVRI